MDSTIAGSMNAPSKLITS